jgi:myo-inositol-1(or 4)-monophosphatase
LPASDHAAIAATLTAAVRDAGALALTTFQGTLKHWTKGQQNSPVSEADLAVDALLKDRLYMPGIAWLSEETEDDPARLQVRRVWVVDPIDGTRAYIAGLPDWTISVALVEDGRPIVAALFAPVADEFFAATLGAGATCNGAPIRVTSAATLAGARIAGPKRAMEDLAQHEPTLAIQPRVASLALRLARVAQGSLDAAYAGGNSHDWDLAAADLLVHEAEGILTTLAGETAAYNRPEPVHGPLVAAGRSRAKLLCDLLRARQA